MLSELDVRIGYRPVMSAGPVPSAVDLVKGLSLLATRLVVTPASGPLVALRERLIGELLGDSERAIAPLGPDFFLVTHVGGATTTTDRAGVVATLQGLGERDGHLMACELAELVSDDDGAAGHGALCSMSAQPQEADAGGEADRVSVSRIPFAFFVRCDGDRMTSETIFLDLQGTEVTELEGTLASLQDGLAAAVETLFGS